MNKNNSHSVCTRCGKRRVFVSTESRTEGTSTVFESIAVCADPDCQAKVDQSLKKETDKRDQYRNKEADKKVHWRKT